ncbi:MAG: HDOD domain-containing protein [Proteobacteria bacterium]|nr:HDOD domain-containing protein [Pseudomonadota bacterium]MBU1585021.1 HDOD domain-containing protein [Pseudomonadota bacterium]MBU2455607.1 HDOD domain-containing protein [Pseudomonadota bacterium]MBU2630114.1 HDOD domain-containing protein [Pseudomonadota bacterium]
MQTDRSFLEIIEEYVESDKVTLPPFDKTALRIQQEIQKKEVQISKIEKLIIADPAMSSQILKVANSAFFRGLSKVMTIREAIVRMGLDEITRMALILTQKKLYETNDTFIKNYRNALWQHALVCALVSQWVAREAGFEETTQEVFFASLMHDIGKLFLITVIEKIKSAKDVPFMPSSAVINEIIKGQHAEQGYNLLKKWNIPDKYCQVAKEHHDEKFDTTNVSLIILRLVNKTCNKIGVSIEKNNDAATSVTAEAAFFGFSEIKLAELELQIEDSIKRVGSHYNIGGPAK